MEVCHQSFRRNILLQSKLFGPEEESLNSDSSGGADLAKDFFQELRQRNLNLEEMEETLSPNYNANGSTNTNMLSNSKASSLPGPSIGTDDLTDQSTSPVIRRKFTGKQPDEQRSFFAQDQISSPSSGQARTPREMMMEREYQLVRRAENGIIGQAIVAVLALAFYIYVGLSGGIVSGRDAQMEDWGADDEIPFEQLMPVQRDREVSVWL